MLKDKKNPVLKNNGYQSSYNEVDSDTPHAKIKSIKQLADKKLKCLYLDVDGVLCAMQYNPNFLKVKKAKWDSYFRTDFCHWLNSIYVVLNKFCNVFIISNYSHESEKKAKDTWLKENIKFKFHLILNKEGNTKSHFAGTKNDILVDDSLSNLDHWHRANGSIFAYQYVTCEKGRRHLLSTLIEE